jgi:hypothetical protein
MNKRGVEEAGSLPIVQIMLAVLSIAVLIFLIFIFKTHLVK